ncbi:hypothetical protein ENUP19_0121G0032 [Entamoeba nuttalli]
MNNIQIPFFSLQLIHSTAMKSDILESYFTSFHRIFLERTQTRNTTFYELTNENEDQGNLNISRRFGSFKTLHFTVTSNNNPLFLFDENQIINEDKVLQIRPPINDVSCITYWNSIYGEYIIIGQTTGFISFVDLKEGGIVKTIRIVASRISSLKVVKTTIGYQLIIISEHDKQQEITLLLLQKQNKSIFEVNSTFIPVAIGVFDLVSMNENEIICYSKENNEIDTFTIDTDRYVHSYTFDLKGIKNEIVGIFHTNETIILLVIKVISRCKVLNVEIYSTYSFISHNPLLIQTIEIPNEYVIGIYPNKSISSHIKYNGLETLKYLDGIFICTKYSVYRIDPMMSLNEILETEFLRRPVERWKDLIPIIKSFSIPTSFFIYLSNKLPIEKAYHLIEHHPKLYKNLFIRLVKENTTIEYWDKLTNILLPLADGNPNISSDLLNIFIAKAYKFNEHIDTTFIEYILNNQHINFKQAVTKLYKDKRYISYILKKSDRYAVELYCTYIHSLLVKPTFDWINEAVQRDVKISIPICSTPQLLTSLSIHDQFQLLKKALQKEPKFILVTSLRNIIDSLNESDLSDCLQIVEPGMMYNCICLGNDGIEDILKNIRSIIIIKQNIDSLNNDYDKCYSFFDSLFSKTKANFNEVYEYLILKEYYFACAVCLVMYKQHHLAIELLLKHMEVLPSKEEVLQLVMKLSLEIENKEYQIDLFDKFLRLSVELDISSKVFNQILKDQFKANSSFVVKYFLDVTFKEPIDLAYEPLLYKIEPSLLSKFEQIKYRNKNTILEDGKVLQLQLLSSLNKSIDFSVQTTVKLLGEHEHFVVWCPKQHSFDLETIEEIIKEFQLKYPTNKVVKELIDLYHQFKTNNNKGKLICPFCLKHTLTK